jgi:hypothetical protein
VLSGTGTFEKNRYQTTGTSRYQNNGYQYWAFGSVVPTVSASVVQSEQKLLEPALNWDQLEDLEAN